jgi:hypothetical protein
LASADAFELDARLRRALRLEQRLDAEIAPLLRHVVCAGHEWRVRFHTLAAYAREHLGMSASKARALLRLERVGDVCGELRAAYRDGALSWVQAQTLVPLLLVPAEGEWRPLWIRFAQTVSVRRLEDVVRQALLWRETGSAGWDGCRGDPEQAVRSLDAAFDAEGEAEERQTCARPTVLDEGLPLRIPAPQDVVRLFRAVLCTVRRALEREIGRPVSEALAFEAMIDHSLRAWGVDDLWLRTRSKKKYAVFERDGWRTSSFVRPEAPTRSRTRRLYARSTTCVACMRTSCASPVAPRTSSGTSWAPGRMEPRWLAIAPGIGWRRPIPTSAHAADAEVFHLEELVQAVVGAFAADARLLHATEGCTLIPTIPYSSASPTRQVRPISRL